MLSVNTITWPSNHRNSRFYVTFFWSVFVVFLVFRSDPVTGLDNDEAQASAELINSTVACTRGSDRTMHGLVCADNELLVVERLFYGTTPTSSGCSIDAPYDNCCRQDPDKNCVFESDYKLDDVVIKCTQEGKSECQFSGQSVNSLRGNCDRALFPSITSFSFIEYSCLSTTNLFNVCPTLEKSAEGLTLYLDSNIVHKNENLGSDEEEDCGCVLYTKCGATVTLKAILVQLRKINETDCVEELTLEDLKNDTATKKKYSCQDHPSNLAINNQVLMTSVSNALMMKLHILEKHNGRILISATSSDPSSTVGIRCGPKISENSLPLEYYCERESTPSAIEDNDDVNDNDIDFDDDDENDEEEEQQTENNEDSETTEKPPDTVGNNSGLQNGDNDKSKGWTVVVKKDSEEIHSGAIAGIVLAVVGILLVISQVVYFLFRRHQKNVDRLEDDRAQSNGGSSLGPIDIVNPTFVHDVSMTSSTTTESRHVDNENDHVYDVASGTASGRYNRVYNTLIGRDVAGPDGARNVSMPEKDVTDFSPENDNASDGKEDEDYTVIWDKEYGYEQPPPPYDHN